MSIKKFMDQYWPWPHNTQGILQALQEGDPSTLKEQILEYRLTLFHKEGPKRIEQYLQYTDEYFLDPTQDSGQDFLTKVYGSSMMDFDYLTLIRSRCTLELLLSTVEKCAPRKTIVDLGCGDGRISVGLTRYFKDIHRLYAVDCNKKAITRTRAVARPVRSRVRSIVADYTKGAHQVRKKHPLGVDLVLSSHTAYVDGLDNITEEVIPAALGALGPTGQVILCGEVQDKDPAFRHKTVHALGFCIQDFLDEIFPAFQATPLSHWAYTDNQTLYTIVIKPID